MYQCICDNCIALSGSLQSLDGLVFLSLGTNAHVGFERGRRVFFLAFTVPNVGTARDIL